MYNRALPALIAAATLTLPCFASVNVSSPANGSTVGSPTTIRASANSSRPVTAMAVYVDNNLVAKTSGSSINQSISMSGGRHSMVVQAWDTSGAVQKSALTVNVSGSGSAPPARNLSSGNTFANIDQMSGWQNCGACAGAGGHGVVVAYSLKQHVNSPSLDGQAAQFWIGGGKRWGDALWWKQLGAKPNATHFSYDVYFYLQNPGAAQALEFDINQSVNGRKYIFGHQCNAGGDHQWDVWNEVSHHWVATGIACSRPTPYVWHHLTLQAQRAGGQTHYISITLDGRTSYVNRYYGTYGAGGQELNIAVQLDTNASATAFSEWIDRASLTYY